MGGITVTLVRWNVIDYLYPHAVTPITFVTSYPKNKISNSIPFINFEFIFLINIFLSFLLTFITILLIRRILLSKSNYTISWTLFSMLIKQPVPTGPITSSSFFLISAAWLFMCFILFTFYGGTVYKSITFPNELDTIDTIDQLALAQKTGSIDVVAIESSATYQQLKVNQFYFY